MELGDKKEKQQQKRFTDLNANFLHGRWCEQRANGCDDGSVETAHHNGVALLQDAVDENHIDRGAETLDHFHFQNRAEKESAT